MASNDAMEVPSQQKEASPDVSSSRSLGDSDDCESWSDHFGDTTSESDESGCAKVATTTAAGGITFGFGLSNVGKTCVTSLETSRHYFLKGYYRMLGMETVPQPQANEVVFFEDFFTVVLRMLPHPVLTEIL
jgi:hypothetical protein